MSPFFDIVVESTTILSNYNFYKNIDFYIVVWYNIYRIKLYNTYTEGEKMARFSNHIKLDREERYITIATKVGFGEVIYTTESKNAKGTTKMELTTTGVVIVRALDATLITLYCATIPIIKKYFRFEKIPRDLYFVVKNNEKRGYCNI